MWLILQLDPHANSAVMHYNTQVWLPPGHRDACAVSFLASVLHLDIIEAGLF